MGMAGSPAEWGGGREDAARYSHEEIMAQVRRAITATRARGVFLDEFSSLKGPHAVRADWYRALLASIRREYGLGFLIVGNPGVVVLDKGLVPVRDGSAAGGREPVVHRILSQPVLVLDIGVVHIPGRL